MLLTKKSLFIVRWFGCCSLALFKFTSLHLFFSTYSNAHNQLLVSESHRMQMDCIFRLERVLEQSFHLLQRLI